MKTIILLLFILLTNSLVSQHTLLKDIDTTFMDNHHGGITSFEILNNQIIAGINIGNFNNELCYTDGTDTGTIIIKDIYQGTYSSRPDEFLKISNNKVLFVADNPSYGRELYVTDGTSNGTIFLKDIYTGVQSSSIKMMISNNGIGYFSAEDNNGITNLWRSDGTIGGTYKITNLSVSAYFNSKYFAISGNIVYFYSSGKWIYKTDGTSYGTTQLNGSSLYNAKDFTIFNNQLYFIYANQLKKCNNNNTIVTVSSSYTFKRIKTAGSYIYCGVSSPSNALYKYNGSSFSLVNQYSNYPYLLETKDSLLFIGVKPSNYTEFYKININNNNYSFIGNINGSNNLKGIKSTNNIYFRYSNNNVIFRYNFSANSFQTINLPDDFDVEERILSLNSNDYFVIPFHGLIEVNDSSNAISEISYGSLTNSALPYSIRSIKYKDKVFISTDPNSSTISPSAWVTDGTIAGTKEIYFSNNASSISNISIIESYEDYIYILACHYNQDIDLYKLPYNDTNAIYIKEIANWYYFGDFREMNFAHILNNQLIFGFEHYEYNGKKGLDIFKTDGTSSGTQKIPFTIVEIDPISTNQKTVTKLIDNKLFLYIWSDITNQRELWEINSNFTSSLVKSGIIVENIFKTGNKFVITPYPQLYDPAFNVINFILPSSLNVSHKFVLTDTVMYFIAYDSQHGNELWKSDYSQNSATRITDINQGSTSSLVRGFLEKSGDKVFFFYRDNQTKKNEIWAYDIVNDSVSPYFLNSNGTANQLDTFFNIYSSNDEIAVSYSGLNYSNPKIYLFNNLHNYNKFFSTNYIKSLNLSVTNYYNGNLFFKNDYFKYNYNPITNNLDKIVEFKINYLFNANHFVSLDTFCIFTSQSTIISGNLEYYNFVSGNEIYKLSNYDSLYFNVLSTNVCDSIEFEFKSNGLRNNYNYHLLISNNLSFSTFDTLYSFKTNKAYDRIYAKIDSTFNVNSNYYLKLIESNRYVISPNPIQRLSTHPNLSLSIPYNFCKNDSNYQITNYSPLGGSFSGDMVYNDIIYLDSLNSGNHSVTYKYSDSLHCPAIVTSNFTLNSNPTLDIGQDSTICEYSIVQLFSPYPSSLWSSGDTTQFVIIDSTGVGIGDKTVSVIVEENNCYGYDTIIITFEDCSQSINEINQFNFNYYPNPVKEIFHISFNESINEKITLKLYNSSSELLLITTNEFLNKDESIDISMSGFANGVYYLRIESKDKISFIKIIKL